MADTDASTLNLNFELPAAPEAVFAAWTEADRVKAWWQDEGVYRTEAWRADVRVGGAWRADFADVTGNLSFAEGRYLAVERPGRLTWTWRDSWEPDLETTIDMRFDASPGGATMRLVQTAFPSAGERDDNAEVWAQVVRWLRDYLAGG